MGDYKFDRFYYSVDQGVHPLTDLVGMDDDQYYTDYHGKMYCPLCHIPQIGRVVNDGHMFLRAFPKQHHGEVDGEMCMYEHDTAPNGVVVRHIDGLRDRRQLQNSLHAVIRMMMHEPGNDRRRDGVQGQPGGNPLIIHRVRGGNQVAEVIPHYSLLNWGPNIPQDQLLVAYCRRVYIHVHMPQGAVGDQGGGTDGERQRGGFWRFYRDESRQQLLSSMSRPYGMEIVSGYYRFAAVGYCVQNGNYYNFKPYTWNDGIYVVAAE